MEARVGRSRGREHSGTSVSSRGATKSWIYPSSERKSKSARGRSRSRPRRHVLECRPNQIHFCSSQLARPPHLPLSSAHRRKSEFETNRKDIRANAQAMREKYGIGGNGMSRQRNAFPVKQS